MAVYTLWTEFQVKRKIKNPKRFPQFVGSGFEIWLIYIAAKPLTIFLLRKLMHDFTPEDLLSYLYQEASPQQAAELEEALKLDWTLREKLAVMKTAMERLNTLTVSPRTEVVLNVLKYAATQQTVKTS